MMQPETIDKVAQRIPQNLPFRPSRPFDFFLWLEHDGLDTYVTELAERIDASSVRRKRDAATQGKFIFSLKLILLNLLAAEKATLKTLQAVPHQSGVFTAKTRYDQKHVAYRPFTEAHEGLENLKLIRITENGWKDRATGKGKVTRIEATHTLHQKLNTLFPQDVVYFIRHPDEENIRLRNEGKKLMEYTDTDYTRTARDNLKVINACLNRHWYDLRLSNAGFETMYEEMAQRHEKNPKKPSAIRFSDRSLYRIYNNGDILDGEAFKQGGRFYGGWWEGIPSEYRKKIMIDDKPAVEIDYSSFHPRMLYALEGMNMGDHDPYLPDGLDERWRDLGKLAFTKLLNAKKRLNRPVDYDAGAVGMSWMEFLAAMGKHLAPIAKYFRTGYGLDLQRKDSDIAEKIILDFARRDIPCLPVHDSFIVHHAHADELKDMMQREYERVFGQDIGTKIKDGFQLFVKEQQGKQGEVLHDIQSILQDEQENQYDRRLNLWWEHKGDTLLP